MASRLAAPANANATRRTTGKAASRALGKRLTMRTEAAPPGIQEGAGAQKTARTPSAARARRSTAASADRRTAEMLQALRTRGAELTTRINALLHRLG